MSHVARRGLLALLTAALFPACSGDVPDESHSYTVKDSSGIRIVENRSQAWGEGTRWTITPEPVITVGVAEGPREYMLFGVSDALRLADGRLAIVNNGSQEVRFYDSTGAYVGAIGGRGEGPGEFRMPWKALRLAGDTLVVWDMAFPGSLSRFDPTGKFLDRQPIDRARLDQAMPGWFSEGGSLLPDGTLLLRFFEPEGVGTGDRTGRWQRPFGFVRTTAEATRLDTIGFFPGMEQFGYEYEGRVQAGALPYGRNTYVVGGGEPLRVYVADNGRYEIKGVSPEGAPEIRIRRDVDPMPVTDQDVREAEDAYRGFLKQIPESERARFEAFLGAVEYPDSRPVLGPMVVDLEGYLWVAESGSDGEGVPTSIYDPDGAWLGTVELPADLQVTEIGTDYVLGLKRDELGVETVILYGLKRI